jgi:hypothetical protein
VHTNDVQEYSKTTDKLERIDTSTRRSIRKGTTGLFILDPNKNGLSAEVMLVNYDANMPLIHAAYENHHTREIAAGVNNYLSDKIHDVNMALRIWKLKFPELTDELIDRHVRKWIKNVVVPHLKHACCEKLAYYHEQIADDTVHKPLKAIIQACIQKNKNYLVCIEELSERSDIQKMSTIIQQQTT